MFGAIQRDVGGRTGHETDRKSESQEKTKNKPHIVKNLRGEEGLDWSEQPIFMVPENRDSGKSYWAHKCGLN
jgi:hypothetical protein